MSQNIRIGGKLVDEDTIEIDGVDSRDYPDFCDAYFTRAEFVDGTELTESELEELQHQQGELLNTMAHESLH
jgi:hypothetical protein